MIKKVVKLNRGLRGEITVPADKSISHRAVIFCSIAAGSSIIRNFSNGQDPLSSLNIMQSLGANIERVSESSIKITSSGNLTAPKIELDCGNSGTTMRLLSGILASQGFNSVLIGDESLSKRPMKRVITPLELMGAKIIATDNHAPLRIFGQKLNGIEYVSPLASAQVKTCVLLAGLYAQGQTAFTEPCLSRNHSELMLKYLGADIRTNGTIAKIKPSKLYGREIDVCGDISSAAYFIVAALIVPGSEIILKNIGLNPTRTGILDVAKIMGGSIEILDKRELSGEPVGDIRVKYSELKGCEISGEIIPGLIDEIPVIAVLATQATGETVIKNAQDLRNKESDRLKAITTELKKIGANIEELDNGLKIFGKTKLKGDAEIEVYHDHRIAMSLYVAGLVCEKEVAIKDFEWVGISFPEFETLFRTL